MADDNTGVLDAGALIAQVWRRATPWFWAKLVFLAALAMTVAAEAGVVPDLSPALKVANDNSPFLSALATVVIAAFTITLWIVGRNQHTVAMGALEQSRKDFAAEHRPWLQIEDATIDSGMSFYRGQTAIRVAYTLHNVGSAPATDFLMYGRVIGNRDQMSISRYVLELASQYTDVKRSSISTLVPATVIFPSQSIPERQEFPIQLDDVAYTMGNTKLFSPIIIMVGCYRSPHDGTTKFTSCVFNVLINGASIQMPDTQAAMEPIEHTRLRLQKWFAGWTAC